MNASMSNSSNQSLWPSYKDGLAYLELQPYGEKIRRWAGPTPLKLASREIRTPKPDFIAPNEVELADGNIISMPKLIGRPCFGISTAWLRHGGDQRRYVRILNDFKESRCMLCDARQACSMVAIERITLCPEVHPWIKKWFKSGGRGKMNTKERNAPILSHWKWIIAELQKVTFTSSNDDVVRAHYEALRQEALDKDRERKRRGRAKAIAAGHVDQAFLDQLQREAFFRYTRLREIRKFVGEHISFRRLDERGAKLTADVWRYETLLSLGGKKPTAYAIAKSMVADGYNQGLGLGTLRARIPQDRERIRRLERSPWPGSSDTIWPVFNVATDLEEIDTG
jgi:hypothetical protein